MRCELGVMRGGWGGSGDGRVAWLQWGWDGGMASVGPMPPRLAIARLKVSLKTIRIPQIVLQPRQRGRLPTGEGHHASRVSLEGSLCRAETERLWPWVST